jgi:hypothetical protein
MTKVYRLFVLTFCLELINFMNGKIYLIKLSSNKSIEEIEKY